MMRNTQGFTVVELAIAVACIGVLAAAGLPSFTAAISASKASAARSALHAALVRSVSRAGNTGTPIVLCPTRAGTCAPSSDWAQGWLAFSDLDHDRRHSLQEPLLLTEPALPAGIQLITSAGRTTIAFHPGGGNAGSNVTFTLCDTRGARRAVSLVLPNTGRLREEPASATNAARCMAQLARRA